MSRGEMGHTGLYYNNNNPLPLIVDAFIRGSLLLYHSLARLASDTVSIDGPDEFDQSLNILRPASQSSPNRCVLPLTIQYSSKEGLCLYMYTYFVCIYVCTRMYVCVHVKYRSPATVLVS